MRVALVLFDTLIKKALDVYGGKVGTPNFTRLANKSVVFDSHYVGSMPCMPARRDLHTGRMHFLHTGWGSLEPFDVSLPKHLRAEKQVHSHIITDHPHYFEYGGWGYCAAFNNWEFFRGQEGDHEKSVLGCDVTQFAKKYAKSQYPVNKDNSTIQSSTFKTQHIINREYFIKQEQDFSLTKCFNAAFEFITTNHSCDNWFLQLECFDPHEPHFAPDRFRAELGINEDEPIEDWLSYERMHADKSTAKNICNHYKALLKACDAYLGKLLDYFDQYNMWDDTCLLLTTDHGLLHGEHDLWGKSRESYYEEISHIPLFFHHPHYKKHHGERRSALTQTPDIMPTILDCFGVDKPREVTGTSLIPLLSQDSQKNRTIIFGIFGGPIGITDGEYVYYHYPDDLSGRNNLYEYTLMPEHLQSPFSIEELQTAELSEPFAFTKGVRLLKIKALDNARRIPKNNAIDGEGFLETESRLYHLPSDPQQKHPLQDAQDVIEYLKSEMVKRMVELDAPKESFVRFGLS